MTTVLKQAPFALHIKSEGILFSLAAFVPASDGDGNEASAEKRRAGQPKKARIMLRHAQHTAMIDEQRADHLAKNNEDKRGRGPEAGNHEYAGRDEDGAEQPTHP